MKEFLSEYGLTILESIGATAIIVLLYFIFLNGGVFNAVLTNFIKSLTGGN